MNTRPWLYTWLHCKAGCWQHWIQCSWTTFFSWSALLYLHTSNLPAHWAHCRLQLGHHLNQTEFTSMGKHGKTVFRTRNQNEKNTSHKSHNWRILANIGHMYHGHCAVVIPPLRRVISLLQGQIGNPTSPSQWCVEIALAFLGSLCHF